MVPTKKKVPDSTFPVYRAFCTHERACHGSFFLEQLGVLGTLSRRATAFLFSPERRRLHLHLHPSPSEADMSSCVHPIVLPKCISGNSLFHRLPSKSKSPQSSFNEQKPRPRTRFLGLPLFESCTVKLRPRTRFLRFSPLLDLVLSPLWSGVSLTWKNGDDLKCTEEIHRSYV